MFEISDDARDLILARLEDALEGRPELRRSANRPGLRLNFRQNKAYLSLAFPKTTDEVVTFMGRPFLIVAQEDLSVLEGVCLTVQQGPGGDGLSMVRRTVDVTL